jgi:acyl-phosphate glycerol 3-phosphate acyltransferase
VEISIVLKYVVVVLVSYLLGSLSWAYLVGRTIRRIDMTEVGNGRIGTSFAIQKLGLGWGLVVGVLDFLKGTVAVVIALLLASPLLVTLACALAVVAGHNWSVLLGFKGGRGAATSFGVLAVLAPLPLLITIAVMAGPFLLTRRSPFIAGLRRTTLLFGAFLLVVAAVLWLDVAFPFLPALPWWPGRPTLMIALPPCLLGLNIAGRPEARRV